MPKTKKRGGQKAHNKRIKQRNELIRCKILKAQKMFDEAMKEQLEKFRESLSGETENTEVYGQETSEVVQLNLGDTKLTPEL